jgi:Holliday junction resolvase RusA-like endonuclease
LTRAQLIEQGYQEIAPGQWAKPSIAAQVVPGKPPSEKRASAPKRMGHLNLPLRSVSLYLKGDPMPKQSVRSYANGSFRVLPNGKKSYNVFHYQPKEMDERKEDCQRQIREQLPSGFQMFTTRVHVRKLHYLFAPLKSFSKAEMDLIKSGEVVYKETQPDLPDNLQKLPFDSMAGIVYKNDGMVVTMDGLSKHYGLAGAILIELEGH